jgi:hypothetical protein
VIGGLIFWVSVHIFLLLTILICHVPAPKKTLPQSTSQGEESHQDLEEQQLKVAPKNKKGKQRAVETGNNEAIPQESTKEDTQVDDKDSDELRQDEQLKPKKMRNGKNCMGDEDGEVFVSVFSNFT